MHAWGSLPTKLWLQALYIFQFPACGFVNEDANHLFCNFFFFFSQRHRYFESNSGSVEGWVRTSWFSACMGIKVVGHSSGNGFWGGSRGASLGHECSSYHFFFWNLWKAGNRLLFYGIRSSSFDAGSKVLDHGKRINIVAYVNLRFAGLDGFPFPPTSAISITFWLPRWEVGL